MTAWSQTWQLRVTGGHRERQQSELELDHPGISGAVSSAGRQIIFLLTLNSIVLQAVTVSLSWQTTSSVYQLGECFKNN